MGGGNLLVSMGLIKFFLCDLLLKIQKEEPGGLVSC